MRAKFIIAVIITAVTFFCACAKTETLSRNTDYSSETAVRFNENYDYSAADNIKLTDLCEKVQRGKKAYITVRGVPEKYYGIKVIYSSGVSKSEALVKKKSDKNGYCTWNWRVGAKTKTGIVNIEITDGDKTVLKTHIEIT